MRIPVIAAAVLAGAALSAASAQQVRKPAVSKTPLPVVTATQMAPNGGYLQGSDDCSTPEPIAGDGVYAFTTGTTGSQGQNEALCYAFGTSGITNDVWYAWTAGSGGNATMQMCGLTSVDTKIAAYPGSGCPANGTALACNDDTCGLQSSITFSVTSGTTYTLQVGTFPGASGGSGSFNITTSGGGGGTGSDGCATPDPVAGEGVFPFSTVGATTGSEGQAECIWARQDVWFEWTPSASGQGVVSLCGGASFDTTLLAYPGGGCPANGTSIGCNDDFCGLQSEISFPVTAGTPYLIQMGAFSTGVTGSGTFTTSVEAPPPPPQCDMTDDGSYENALGLTNGGDLVGLLQVTCDDVVDIWASYGSALFPDPSMNGLPSKVFIWADSDGDVNPGTGLTLLHQQDTVVTNAGTDILNCNDVPDTAIGGDGWIGVLTTQGAGQFPLSMDTTNPSPRTWFGYHTTPGAWDPNNVPGNSGLFSFNSFFPSSIGLRANQGDCPSVCAADAGPGTAYCCGEGCPCANDDPTAGCANSGGSGATLGSGGTASVTNDDLEMHASGMLQGQPCQLFSATQQMNGGAGFPFLDGLRCTGVALIRHDVRLADVNGDASWVGGLASQAGATAGDTRQFQVYYRDVVSACGAGANTTNATEIVFGP